MTDHAHELRRYARKITHPAGDVPSVMLAAADEIERLAAMLEAAEKERDNANAAAVGIALQAETLQAERDTLRAKIAEMERQEQARLVTPTAYRWRYRGAVKWQYGELTEEVARLAKEHNHEVQVLGILSGAQTQPAPSVPDDWPIHADPFAYVIQHLNSNPYPLTKDETIAFIMELRALYNAATEAKP